MAKKMIIKGVGQMLAKRYSPTGNGVEVVRLGTLQNLRIDLDTQIEDIFGGDGLFPIDTLVTGKNISISATDAKFDLANVALMMGSTVQEQQDTYLWVLGEEQTVSDNAGAGAVTPNFADTVYGDGNFSVTLKDDNKVLTQIPYDGTNAPKADEFMWDATNKKIIVNSAHVGKAVVLSYQRVDVVDMVDLLVDEVPFPVQVIHHGSFLQKDGTYRGIETELYSCMARGTFTIDAQRVTASASTVELQIIDPERADGKLGTIKLFSSTTKV